VDNAGAVHGDPVTTPRSSGRSVSDQPRLYDVRPQTHNTGLQRPSTDDGVREIAQSLGTQERRQPLEKLGDRSSPDMRASKAADFDFAGPVFSG